MAGNVFAERGWRVGMKIFKCAIPFVIALAIIYCAYIGETMCVSVLSSALAFYAARGYLHDEVVKGLKRLPSAQTEIDRPQVEWTHITKGLPKETGTVLITQLSPFSPSGREVVSAWLDDDGLFYDSGWGTMMYSDVLAWAYPPKPYMGERASDE